MDGQDQGSGKEAVQRQAQGRQATAAMSAFDEMTSAAGGSRPGYDGLKRWLDQIPIELLSHRRAEAELLFRRIGITFAVYGESEGEERIIPFDIIPRILTRSEWSRLSRGLEQRVR